MIATARYSTAISQWLGSATLWLLSLTASAEAELQSQRLPDSSTEQQAIVTEVLIRGLDHPWSVEFIPDNRMVISERSGQLRVIEYQLINGTLIPTRISPPVSGLPEIWTGGQGGLLDLAWHDDLLYFSYSEPGELLTNSTAVMRARLVADGKGQYQLQQQQKVFTQQPKYLSRAHFGSRLVFDDDGYLFITLGERYFARDDAQVLDNHLGKIVRIHPDGRIPADNPFTDIKGAEQAIWTLGHRNPQGAVLHPQSRELWSHEHGPRGGDELNRIQRGHNYGWPVITYGKEYVGGNIGEGFAKAGMEQPNHYWVPSIAPSGMEFLTSDRYPGWQNNLFIGSLKFRQLVRLQLQDDRVSHEERINLQGLSERIRDVKQGPDGLLYLLTDEDDGKLVRLLPGQATSLQ
ncbi:PQQ-dependent sugar dehydrogenase [Oceanobacter mangrovi]|uniref:PQQ-dependent sugar dehydrogenase n=1 Tax=Oceanobacter mangrovi TaxID=2862510 RepID=UPI001C8DB7FC|nr:PQQ-dependent sugar dehydrogenase [Oceanobacter mangrovi]